MPTRFPPARIVVGLVITAKTVASVAIALHTAPAAHYIATDLDTLGDGESLVNTVNGTVGGGLELVAPAPQAFCQEAGTMTALGTRLRR